MIKKIMIMANLSMLVVLVMLNAAVAQEQSTEELIKAAQNPVANVMSFPFQNNTNFGVGPDNDRTQNVLNIQPVIPFGKGNWNYITRTIFPVIYQPDFTSSDDGTWGLGDINASIFLSPAEPGRFIWGAGPVFSLPTATDDTLGSGKWGIGPSAVGVVMPGHWVLGALINNIWSFAGDDDRGDVNQMLFQYFINYNFPSFYLSSAPIITANWEAPDDQRWTVPFGLGIGKVFHAGKLPLNTSFQGFYNVVKPDYGPDWTMRVQIQFMLPKG